MSALKGGGTNKPAGRVGVGEEVGKPTLIKKIEYLESTLDIACDFIIQLRPEKIPTVVADYLHERHEHLEDKIARQKAAAEQQAKNAEIAAKEAQVIEFRKSLGLST